MIGYLIKQPHSGSNQHLTKNTTGEYLCLPMIAHGNTIGVLHLEFLNRSDPQYDSRAEGFRESQQRIAITAASQVALSLASQQLRETLREQATRDPLTRLFNRRFLEESLERELQLAVRKKHSVAVLFFDLDHFKRFNDSFGHEAGDMVLQSLADPFRNFFARPIYAVVMSAKNSLLFCLNHLHGTRPFRRTRYVTK